MALLMKKKKAEKAKDKMVETKKDRLSRIV